MQVNLSEQHCSESAEEPLFFQWFDQINFPPAAPML